MAGRKPRPADKDPFGEQVTWAWVTTSKDQRERVFEDFVNGHRKHHQEVAYPLRHLHVDANAILLASLLEFGHESVCKLNGQPRCNSFGKLCEMMLSWKPVDNCRENVDNSQKTVDNSVEKKGAYPQEFGLSTVEPVNVENLSTFPHFIHSHVVDKMA